MQIYFKPMDRQTQLLRQTMQSFAVFRVFLNYSYIDRESILMIGEIVQNAAPAEDSPLLVTTAFYIFYRLIHFIKLLT